MMTMMQNDNNNNEQEDDDEIVVDDENDVDGENYDADVAVALKEAQFVGSELANMRASFVKRQSHFVKRLGRRGTAQRGRRGGQRGARAVAVAGK
jgi:hypothetical protein